MTRTLLFDLDGTLTDNYTGIANCIRHALARLDVEDPGEPALQRCVGPPLRESFAHLLGTQDRARIEAAIGHYRERYREHGWRENVSYDGIAEALDELASGARLFVCTSKPEVFATRIVAHFGFDRHFRRVYGADLAGTLDDKRRLLAHLLERESLAPGTCTMIGDREHDIHAAQANGMRSVGVLWGYGSREELERARADMLASSPRELVAAIG